MRDLTRERPSMRGSNFNQAGKTGGTEDYDALSISNDFGLSEGRLWLCEKIGPETMAKLHKSAKL